MRAFMMVHQQLHNLLPFFGFSRAKKSQMLGNLEIQEKNSTERMYTQWNFDSSCPLIVLSPLSDMLSYGIFQKT